MPWNEVKPMDEKVLFIADCLRERCSFTQLCEHYGISRKTGYKWLGRYRSDGLEGLDERSRRPHRYAGELPHAIRQAILELRGQGRDLLGPKKIQVLLARRYADQPVPSRTTIYNVLKRAGQIEPQRRRRRVSPQPSPLAPAKAPNELWSADYKGQFKTRDGRWCYPLTIMDHASRYLLSCRGLEGTRLNETRAVFEQLFKAHGLPERLRTDNGVPVSDPVDCRAYRSGGFGWGSCRSASRRGSRSRTVATSACTIPSSGRRSSRRQRTWQPNRPCLTASGCSTTNSVRTKD